MFFFRTWARRFANYVYLLSRRGRRAQRSRRHFAPGVEHLEPKIVPVAPNIWQGGSTGFWDVAANWTQGVPTASMNVAINGGVTVHAAGNDAASTITFGGGFTGVPTLVVDAGGTLSANSITTGSGTFTNHGTVDANNGNMVINGNVTNYSSSSVPMNNSLVGGTWKAEGYTLTLANASGGINTIASGTSVILSGTNSEFAAQGGTGGTVDLLSNLSVNHGTLTIENGATESISANTFTNSGSLTVTGSTSALSVNAGSAFNSGTISAGAGIAFSGTLSNSGTLQDASGGGTITVNGGTGAGLSNSGTIEADVSNVSGLTVITQNGPLTNDGTLQATSGDTLTLSVSSSYAVTNQNDGTVAANAGTITLDDGTNLLELAGSTLTLSSGTLDIGDDNFGAFGAASVTFNSNSTIGGTGTITFDQRNGTLTQGAHTLTINSGVMIDGQNGTIGSNTGTLVNNGIIKASVGSTTINVAGTFTNNGTLDADGAALVIVNGLANYNSTNHGPTAGTYEALNGGTLTLTNDPINTIANGVKVVLDNGNEFGNTSSISTGDSGDALAGLTSIANGGSLSIGVDNFLTSSTSLQVAGTLAGHATVWARVTVASGGTLDADGDYLNLTNLTNLTNLSSPAGDGDNGSDSLPNYTLTTGTYEATNGGHLRFPNELDTNNATIVVSGSGSGMADPDVTSLGHFATNAGTITVENAANFGTDVSFTNSGTLQDGSGGGKFSAAFDLTNAGTILAEATGGLKLAASTFTNVSGKTITVGNGDSFGVVAAWTNYGTIQSASGGGTVGLSSSGSLSNQGTVDAKNANLEIVGELENYRSVAGGTLTSGIWKAESGYKLQLDNKPIVVNDGTIILSGSNSIGGSSDITRDSNNDSALTGFTTNEDNFDIESGVNFTAPSGSTFTTRYGTLTVGGGTTFTANGGFEQQGTGTTNLHGGTLAANVTLDAGSVVVGLQGYGTVQGTVTLGSGRAINAFVDQQTLTITGVVTNNSGMLEATYGGTLNLQSGLSSTNFSAGKLSGGTYEVLAGNNSTGSKLILGHDVTDLDATVVLSGSTSTITDGSSTSAFAGLSTITANGTFSVESHASFTLANALTNAGTLQANFGGSITANAGITNNGTLMAANSNSSLTINGVVTNTGSMEALYGGALRANAGLASTNYANNTLTGGSYEAVNGGTLLLHGVSVVTNQATLIGGDSNSITNGSGDALANFTFNDSAGTFIVDGTFHAPAATTFLNNGAVTLYGRWSMDAQSTYEQGATGSTILGGGNLDVGDNSSQSAKVQIDHGGILEGYGTIMDAVINDGSIRANSPGNDLTFTSTLTNNSDGTITGAGGTLTANATFTNNGTVNTDGSSTFAIYGSITNNHILDANGGTLDVSQSLASADYDSTNAILSGGTYEVSGGGTLILPGAVSDNQATLILDAPDAHFTYTTVSFDDFGNETTNSFDALYNFAVNDGVVELQNGDTLTTAGDVGAGTFTNSATGTIQGAGTISASLVNNGTIDAEGGVLDVSQSLSFADYDGSTLSGGTYEAGSGAVLKLPGTVTTNAATIVLDGTGILSNSDLANALTNFSENDGSFTIQNGATFAQPTTFTNAGTLTIGASSTFVTLGGDLYTQKAGGTTILSGGIQSGLSGAQVTIDQGGTLSGFGLVSDNVTNNGTISAVGGTLEIRGTLSNFYSTTGTLSGGTFAAYNGSTLVLDGVDVQNNKATIILDGSGASIRDGIGDGTSDALAGFQTNYGTFTILNGASSPGPYLVNYTDAVISGDGTFANSIDNDGYILVDQTLAGVGLTITGDMYNGNHGVIQVDTSSQNPTTTTTGPLLGTLSFLGNPSTSAPSRIDNYGTIGDNTGISSRATHLTLNVGLGNANDGIFNEGPGVIRSIGNDTLTLNGALTNDPLSIDNAIIQAEDGGNLVINSTITNYSTADGGTLHGGIWNVIDGGSANGTSLTFGGTIARAINVSAATIVLAGSNAQTHFYADDSGDDALANFTTNSSYQTTTDNTTYNIAGSFTVADGYSFTPSGAFTNDNSGNLVAGYNSTLDFSAHGLTNYSPTGGGTLTGGYFEVNGSGTIYLPGDVGTIAAVVVLGNNHSSNSGFFDSDSGGHDALANLTTVGDATDGGTLAVVNGATFATAGPITVNTYGFVQALSGATLDLSHGLTNLQLDPTTQTYTLTDGFFDADYSGQLVLPHAVGANAATIIYGSGAQFTSGGADALAGLTTNTAQGHLDIVLGGDFHDTAATFTNYGFVEIGQGHPSDGSTFTQTAPGATYVQKAGGNTSLSGTLEGGTLVVEAGSNVSGFGTIAANLTNDGTVTALYTLEISGSISNYNADTQTLTGGVWQAMSGGTLQLDSAPIAVNDATILLDGTNSGITIGANLLNALANFTTNHGGFTIQNGANFTQPTAFTNDGIVQIGDQVSDASTWIMAPNTGATYTQNAGGSTLLQGGTLDGPANISANTITIGSGSTLSGYGTVTGDDIINNGTIVANGSGNSITISGSGVTVTNNGMLLAENGGTVDIRPQLTNFNGGTLTGGTYEAINGGRLFLENMDITTNAAHLLIDGASSIISDPFGGHSDAVSNFLTTNTGSFTIRNGYNFTQPRMFTNTGDVTIGASSLWVMGAGATYTQNSGSTLLQNGILDDNPGDVVDIEGGELAGTGTVQDNLIIGDSGQLGDLNTPGVIIVQGTYTQTGTLAVALVGDPASPEFFADGAGTAFSQLILDNSTVNALNGTQTDPHSTLTVGLGSNFTPNPNDDFPIIATTNGATLTGDFTNMKKLVVNGNLNFRTVGTSSSYDLTAVSLGIIANVKPAVAITGTPFITSGSVTLGSSFTDESGATPATYAWSVNGVLDTSATGENYTFMPKTDGLVTVNLTVTASDGGVGTASTAFLYSNGQPVAAIFGAPALNNGKHSSPEGQAINLTNLAFDPKLAGKLTYVWSVNNVPDPKGTSLNYQFTPPLAGDYTVSLSVKDANNIQSVLDSVTINATGVDPTPVIVNPPTTGVVGTDLKFKGGASIPSATDPETLTWSVLASNGQVVTGNTSNSGTAFDFTPTAAGVYVVALTATTGTSPNTRTATTYALVTVTQPFAVINLTTPASSPQGKPISISATASDSTPNEQFTFGWTITGVSAPFQPVSGTGTSIPSFTPIYAGVYQVIITAAGNDDHSFGSVTRTITVTPVVPIIAITGVPAPLSVFEGGAVNLGSTVTDAADPTNVHTAYEWSVYDPNGKIVAAGVNSAINFKPALAGNYVARLSATDLFDASPTSTQTAIIAIAEPNPNPVIITNTAFTNGSIFDFGAQVVGSAQDLASATYQWTISPATAPYFNPTYGLNFIYNPSSLPPGNYVVTLTVTDGGGTGSISTSLLVVAKNASRVVTAADLATNAHEIVVVALGNDFIDASGLPANVTEDLIALGSHDSLYAGHGPAVIQADSGFNLAVGGTGDDTIYGVANDTLIGGSKTNLFKAIPVVGVPGTLNITAGASAINTLSFSQANLGGITLDLTPQMAGKPQSLGTAPNSPAIALTGQFTNIYLGNGNNFVVGGNGINLFGTDGTDTVTSSGGNNITITAGSGNESLAAIGGTNVSILGGNGRDTLSSSGGANITLIGGSGPSMLQSTGGTSITLFGTGGNDTLTSTGGNNISILASSGLDSLTTTLFPTATTGATATAVGGSGSDTIGSILQANGGTGITLFGSGGNDTLSSTGANNVSVLGTGGNDSLASNGGSNITLIGGAGANPQMPAHDTLTAVGGTSITLFGSSGNDTLSSTGANNVSVMGGSGNNVIMAAPSFPNGPDSLPSGNTSITLFGGTGDDTITSTGGNNISIVGGNGGTPVLPNLITANGGISLTIVGGSGNDSITTNGGTSITLFGSGGDDTITSTGSNNVSVMSGSGNNVINTAPSFPNGPGSPPVGNTSITLFGGSGNDTITTTGGLNISIIGGSGGTPLQPNILTANGGTSITLFGGTGTDTITSIGANNVTVVGGTGNDSLASRPDPMTGGGNTSITLFGGSGNDTITTTGGLNISIIGGSGGTPLQPNILTANGGTSITLFGGTGTDTISSTGANNVTMIGGTGNDSLAAAPGTNGMGQTVGNTSITLFGGSGNDTITITGGNNISVVGGTGHDSISAGPDATGSGGTSITLFGGSGDDTLSSTGGTYVTIVGGSGNASLYASGGTSITLFGTTGNDTLSSTGANNITVVGGSGTDSISSTGNTNGSVFGGSGNDHIISTGDSQVTIIGGSGNSTISVTNGTTITLFGGSGDDSLTSSGSNNVTIIGGGGHDSLSAGPGMPDAMGNTGNTSITLFGGSGDDTLSSTGGQHISVIGGTGNDSLASSGGTSITMFGGSGNDTLTVSGGNDVTVVGGTGRDSLSAGPSAMGGTGGTSITLFGGSGDDTLTSTGGNNISVLGGSGKDLLISNGNVSSTIYGGSGNDTITSTGDSTSTIVGGTGNDSIASKNDTNVTVYSGSGNDTLSNTAGTNVTMIGGQGFDQIATSGGTSITLFGGSGPDIFLADGGSNLGIFGGNGNKFYLIGANTDVALNDLYTIGVNDTTNDNTRIGINTIEFLADVTSGITLDLSNTSLYPGDPNGTPQIVSPKSASNITLTLTGLFQDVLGSKAPSSIHGNSSTNFLVGQSGNDTLAAGSGAATLEAGTGNTTLIGGSGGVTYLLTPPAPNVTSNVVIQPLSTASDTIDLSQLTGSLTLDLGKKTIQTVDADPVTVTLIEPLGIQNVILNAANDNITGNSRGDLFAIGAGSNTITGLGNDTFTFTGSKLGANVINEVPSADSSKPNVHNTLNFHSLGAGINLNLAPNGPTPQGVSAGTGLALTLNNPEAFTTVIGTPFPDSIIGNAGNDNIFGAGGNDKLKATGTGNDLIDGGIPQVVYLDFTSSTRAAGWDYTPDEQASIRANVEALYKSFDYQFTTDLATAQSLARPIGGQFDALVFNAGPPGGAGSAINWRRLDLSGGATVNVVPLLNGSQDALTLTSDHVVALSSEIAAHELGHLAGLRHADAFGPIGSGVYSGLTGSALSRFIDSFEYTSSPFEPPTNATDTLHDVMASPDSVHTPLSTDVMPTSLGERDAVKLAFDENGTTVNEQAGNNSFATAHVLGVLPGLAVPGIAGQTFAVRAIDIVGTLAAPGTEFYSFVGGAGYWNFAVMSSSLQRIANPIPATLSIYDSTNHLLATSNLDLETSDPIVYDLTLAANQTYYMAVSSPTPGSYELFAYSFMPGTPLASGDTLIGNSGNDTVVGNTGSDTIVFPTGSTGAATVLAGSGTDVVNLSAAPGEQLYNPDHVTVVTTSVRSVPTLQVLNANGASASNVSLYQGATLGLTASASDSDSADTFTYAVKVDSTTKETPSGFSFDPVGGAFTWTPTQAGSYTFDFTATDAFAQTVTTTVVVTVNPFDLVPIPNQTVNEDTPVTFTAASDDKAVSLTYSIASLPTGAHINPTTGVFTWTPTTPGSYTFEVVAKDSNRQVMQQVGITVGTVSPSAVQLALSASRINEGDTVTLAGSFTDADPLHTHTIDINWGDHSPHTVVSLAANVLSFTGQMHPYTSNPTGQANGSYAIVVTVTADNEPTSTPASATTAVEVDSTLTGVAIQNADSTNITNGLVNETETDSPTLTGTPFISPELYTYAWSVTNTVTGQPVALGSTDTQSSSVTLPYLQPGYYQVTYTVLDAPGGVSASASVAVTVTGASISTPTITSSTGTFSVDEQHALSLSSSTDSLAGESYTYSWTATQVVNGKTQTVATGTGSTFTLPPTAPGTYTVTSTVSDTPGGQSNSATVAVTVTPLEIDRVTVTNTTTNQVIARNSTVTLDPASTLALSGSYVPLSTESYTTTWTVSSNGGAAAIVSSTSDFTFANSTPGTYKLTYNVTDAPGNKTAFVCFTVIVQAAPISNLAITDTNNPQAVGADTVDELHSLSLAGTHDTVGGENYISGWTVTDANHNIVSTGTGDSFTFPPSAPGTYTVAYNVSDSPGGQQASVPFTVTVTAVPFTDLAIQGVGSTINTGNTLSLHGAFTNAAVTNGNETPTFLWTVKDSSGNSVTSSNAQDFMYLPTVGGIYTVTFNVSDSPGNQSDSASVVVTVNQPPAITSNGNPSNQTVTPGNTATFTAAATGSPTPTVQWQVSTNGGQTWSNAAGASTNTTYTFTASAGQNGNEYEAVFTNVAGTATTTAATLTVNTVPAVTTQPLTQAVTAGSTVSFTAAASGSPTPSVQWQISTDSGKTWSNAPGASSNTTYTFTASAGQNGNEYEAIFTNVAGTATTTAATLTVNTVPAVTTNPASQAATAGASVSFIAAASGSPTPSVQWQVSIDGGQTWSNAAGASTNTTYTFTASAGQNGNEYEAVFTNVAGAATTTAATLTVNTVPAVTTNPSNQTVTAGGTVSFTAAASGSPAPSVQWQVSTDSGKTFTNISGATATTLTLANVSQAMSGYEYEAVFTNTAGTATTTAATLTVNTVPAVTTNPASHTVTAGATVSFTAAASGSPTPSVQWQVSTDSGKTWSNAPGASSNTTYTFTASATQNNSQYRAVFTNVAGFVNTNAATLTVNTVPTVTTQPLTQAVTAGNTATFTVAATGSPTPTVQWQVSTDSGKTWSSAPGASSNTTYSFTASAGQNGNEYEAVFTNVAGAATTTAATLTVNTVPAVTTNPASQAVTAGATVSFTAAATGSPTPTVQWQVSTNGGQTWSNAAGASTNTTYTFTASAGQNGNEYEAVFTNVAGTATTTAATLTVNTVPTVTTQPLTQAVTAGSTATFTAAATGSPTPSVQWQVSTDSGKTWSSAPGASTNTTYTFTASAGQSGNEYEAVFTNTAGTATTTAATLTVNTVPAVTTNPSNQTVTAGATVTFTAAASGSPTPSVQWQVSTDSGKTWSNAPGASTATTYTFTASATQNNSQYRAVFTNVAGVVNANAATLTVNTVPVVSTQPSSVSVTAGGTVSFTAAASGSPTPTVQWQVSTDSGKTFTNISGATTTLTLANVSQTMSGYEYEAVFTNVAGTATTTAATLTVNTVPAVTTNPASQTVTAGATVSFTAAASGSPTPSVQWQVLANTTGATWTNISGATGTTLTLTNTTTAMGGNQYRAVFTNTAGTATTTAATLTVTSTVNPFATVITDGDLGGDTALGTVVRGETRNFTFTATNAPAGVTSFTYTINWGDGTPIQTVSGGASMVVSHVFGDINGTNPNAPTPFTISAVASYTTSNKVTVNGAAGTKSVTVTDAGIQQDPVSGGYLLVVGGSNKHNESIVVSAGTTTATSNSLVVQINNAATGASEFTGTFSLSGNGVFSRVLLIGQASDYLQVAWSVTTLGEIRAGGGDSTLVGGGGANILIGGAGNDLLIGGLGRNLMVGGFGHATMIDGFDQDIMIGGHTNYDQNDTALLAIMKEWNSGDSWAVRIADIMGTAASNSGAHFNGNYLLNTNTVFAVKNQNDLLTTVSSQDLVFGGGGDVLISILSNNDVITIKTSN